MEAPVPLTFWLLQAEVWLILAIILMVADIFLGLNLILLPVGIAALIVSVTIWGEARQWWPETVVTESWRAVLILFGALSVLSVFIIRRTFQRDRGKERDINEY